MTDVENQAPGGPLVPNSAPAHLWTSSRQQGKKVTYYYSIVGFIDGEPWALDFLEGMGRLMAVGSIVARDRAAAGDDSANQFDASVEPGWATKWIGR